MFVALFSGFEVQKELQTCFQDAILLCYQNHKLTQDLVLPEGILHSSSKREI